MKKGYPYIDQMRIIAAILVVAIHISPLLQINETADFILTRIIGRLAVPFYMIVSSYFLFLKGYPTREAIQKTLMSLMKLYLISMILYLPLMIYNHYFTMDHLFFEIIKDVFIDGTFYHLWYFPSMMIGLALVLLCLHVFHEKTTMIITIILYIIGLCGDSYYGLVSQTAIGQSLMTILFQYMDYTRNGFFFVPLFVMIGYKIAQGKSHWTSMGKITMFIICFVFMSIEAFIIKNMAFAKHDSMYIMLPFASYFLFLILIQKQGQRYVSLKNISMMIYIVHPMMIVVTRLIGKMMHMNILIDHYLIQFICVVCLSLIVAEIFEKVRRINDVKTTE